MQSLDKMAATCRRQGVICEPVSKKINPKNDFFKHFVEIISPSPQGHPRTPDIKSKKNLVALKLQIFVPDFAHFSWIGEKEEVWRRKDRRMMKKEGGGSHQRRKKRAAGGKNQKE